ncbi:hypothetical protein B0T14DRAFT_563601 [Immersiella caudata]|uniref:Uncharacterized protein n=1 Tax=Immersiella caudata TaxID=314043 RepID=A0AA39X5V0_9PEZI|nr:hypothetical protein B0T14DRAFT_563601 [Immersiella caudata]
MIFTTTFLATIAASATFAGASNPGAPKVANFAIRKAGPDIDSPKVEGRPATVDELTTTVLSTLTVHDTTSTIIINTIIDPSMLTTITDCDSTTALPTTAASTTAAPPESVITVTSAVAPESIGATNTTFLISGPSSIPANNSLSYYTSTITSTITTGSLSSTVTVTASGNVTYSLFPSNSTLLTTPSPSVTSHKTTAASTSSAAATATSSVPNGGSAMVASSSVTLLSSLIMGSLAVFMLTLP